MFANGLGGWGSIPGQVIPKTQKMVFGTYLLNTQYYKIKIKGKWSNPRKGAVPSPTPVAIENGTFGSPLTMIGQLLTRKEYLKPENYANYLCLIGILETIQLSKLFVLDRNIWYITTCKQTIIENLKY